MLGPILSAGDTGLNKMGCLPSLTEFKLMGSGQGGREATANQQVNNLMK